ncbi:MAG: hypothetical protein U9R60_15550, partial [Bacteroidota bacterium]|nr:hypothetical protein [Bacteroidota bacterium]
MKKCYPVIFITIICALFIPIVDAYAQDVSISAQLRPRFEYRHGYKTLSSPDIDPAFFISQRSRLSALFSSEKFKAGFSLQNVRVWGDVSQLNVSDVN